MRKFCGLLFLGLCGMCMGAGVTHGSETVAEADLSGSESVERLNVGYPLKLSCNMTYSENTTFTLDWYKGKQQLQSDDHVKIFQQNSTLVINSPLKEDVGSYKCQTKPGIPTNVPLHKIFNVVYYEVRKMAKSKTLTNNEDLVLECPVEGKPEPEITWKKDDAQTTILMHNDSRVTLSANENGVADAKLTISKADWSDRGNYSCVITTLIKSYETFTFVRVKDVYAALWPFLGIVAEVLLLGIIIFIFEKRRAKAEFEESDTDQGNDQ